MAYGFELYHEIVPKMGVLGFGEDAWHLCTGQACTAGDALCVSSTAGYLTKATANCSDIAGVAVADVASNASVAPEVRLIDPRNIFKVNRKATETATNPSSNYQLCHVEGSRSIDLSSTAGASSQVRVLGILDTVAAGECLVTFRLAKTIYG